MKYKNIVKGKFLERPNRFIAYAEINGKTETVHVKNTGRCKEILIPGVTCYFEKSNNPNRKTLYDLVCVKKGDRLINIDSQVVNKVFGEYLVSGKYFKNLDYIKPEKIYGKSRIDFYAERGKEKILIEVKGVTLENNNVVSFPDAPTERGTKHIYELIKAHKEGYETYIVFVVQMNNIKYFKPNDETDPKFGQALREGKKEGVKIIALDCNVFENEIFIENKINILL